MTVLSKILYNEVITGPAGETWESDPLPMGKRILLREFGASVGNGTVTLSIGSEIIRAIVDGTFETQKHREFTGSGQRFSIKRINNAGVPRVISAWLDVLIED